MIIYWRRDRDQYLVWRSDWFGDQFVIVEAETMDHLNALSTLGLFVPEEEDPDVTRLGLL